MRRLLIIGCGDVALRAIPFLLTCHYRIFALVHDPADCAGLRKLGAVPILGDLDDRASLARIAGLADAVLHFAPPASTGTHDLRTRNLLGILSQGRLPKRLVYISTSGVYGDCGGAWISETHPLNARTARAQRRVDAESRLRHWGRRNGVNISILRAPGIYAADRLPLDRLQKGMPCIASAEDSYSNHIHADDLARTAVAALHRAKPGRIYHASDDSQMKMGDYFDAVADAFCLPHPPRLMRAEAERAVPPMLWSFMNESRRLDNTRMKRELKIALRYPDVLEALAEISLRC